MSTMKFIKAFFLLFLIGGLISCEDVIDLQLPDGDTLLVVDAWFTDQKGINGVRLSQSAPYFSNEETPAVTGAGVELLDGTGNIIPWTEDPNEPGFYTTDTVGTIGYEYALHITTADGKEYLSQRERMNFVPPILKIYDKFREKSILFQEGWYVLIDTYEPTGFGAYYRWKYYVNGAYQVSREQIAVAEDLLVDGNDIIGLDINFEPMEDGDSVRVEQMSITEEAYTYLSKLQLSLFTGGPFDAPPAPVKGNIISLDDPNEKVLGYFTVSAISAAEKVIGQ